MVVFVFGWLHLGGWRGGLRQKILQLVLSEWAQVCDLLLLMQDVGSGALGTF